MEEELILKRKMNNEDEVCILERRKRKAEEELEEIKAKLKEAEAKRYGFRKRYAMNYLSRFFGLKVTAVEYTGMTWTCHFYDIYIRIEGKESETTIYMHGGRVCSMKNLEEDVVNLSVALQSFKVGKSGEFDMFTRLNIIVNALRRDPFWFVKIKLDIFFETHIGISICSVLLLLAKYKEAAGFQMLPKDMIVLICKMILEKK
jgi:hypothetical protein